MPSITYCKEMAVGNFLHSVHLHFQYCPKSAVLGAVAHSQCQQAMSQGGLTHAYGVEWAPSVQQRVHSSIGHSEGLTLIQVGTRDGAFGLRVQIANSGTI